MAERFQVTTSSNGDFENSNNISKNKTPPPQPPPPGYIPTISESVDTSDTSRTSNSNQSINASGGGDGGGGGGRVSNTQNRRSRLSIRGFNLLRKSEPNERKYSLAQLTRETLPRLDNYRMSKKNLKRPSIGELHGEPKNEHSIQITDAQPEANEHGIKLGWIIGVAIPCLLNIWGVMLFLRLSWVVGQSGIGQSLAIIGISATVCVITTLSLSAISTNGEVKGGGVYFIISRSLGPEFGASVGVVFAFANAVAASMNTIGFCDSLNDLLKSHGLKIFDNGINDVRLVGCITILVLICICCVGMEWEAKAQNFLIITIVLAIFNFLIGSVIGPRNDEEIAQGFVGFSTQTLINNFGSDYRYSEGVDQNFFSVFAIFFPSVTGIQAGANICGDLKDPGGAIPKGTFWALLISMFSYAVFVLFAGGAAARDASGFLIEGTNELNLTCTEDRTCQYGLQNSYSIMQLMSVWGPLIYAGCFAATLSTALTNLLSVPRLVQALGIDQIYPGLIYFSKPYGKHGEPYRGYVLTFFISAGFLLIGQLNVIAPLISNFYLASYAMINFCTFHAAFVKPLGWRPTFKYYNMWLSLFAFALCVAIMFMIDWMSSLITLVIIFALYLVVMYRKPDVNWGSSSQAQQYKAAITAVQRLQNVSDHVKNYHPQVLVLSGDPKIRPPLIDFGYMLTKHNSLMFVGNVMPVSVGYKNCQNLIKEGQKYLDARKIKAFYNVVDGFSVEEGVNAMMKSTGFGKMSPNIVLLGYKSDWRQCRRTEVECYFNILHNAFSMRMGVAILRLPNGLDFSDLNPEINVPNGYNHNPKEGFTNPAMPHTTAAAELLHIDSNLNLASMVRSPTDKLDSAEQLSVTKETKPSHKYCVNPTDGVRYLTKNGSEVPKNMLDAVTVFTRKQNKGTIDVFWLYDDGGLTVLLPYIISMRSNWQNCKLRVFALCHGKDDEMEEKNMANLLTKFRIKYSELIMLKGVSDKPTELTLLKHQELLENFCQNTNNEYGITAEELHSMEEKTWRQLRIHELVQQHSRDAALVVMSLPMPRKEAISAPLYMSWLEMLSRKIRCPLVLARGNQTPVLTFYS